MRKKDLLTIPQTEPPEAYEFCDGTYLARAQQYTLYPERYTGSRSILNIDLYEQGRYLDDDIVLVARYFACISEGSFIAYMAGADEWKAAGIDNIAFFLRNNYMNQNGNYWYRINALWSYASKGDEKNAMDYLKATGSYSIQHWENVIRSSAYYAGLRKKQDRINRMMDEKIPLIPEGFYTWVHEVIFGREYLFQKKDGKLYCTACGRSWKGKTIQPGYTSCPKCGSRVLATFTEAHESKEEQLFLFQRCGGTDEWVERTFRAKAYWEYGHRRFIRWDEQIRVIIPEGKHLGKCYYETGVRGDTGEYSDRNSYQKRIRTGYLYPDNLKETYDLWPAGLKYSGIEILAGQKRKINYNNLIMTAGNLPWLEYLVKGRFYRMAEEIINESRHKMMGLLLTYHVRSPQDLLRLGPSQVDRLRQQDGGFIKLSWLQEEYKTGRRIANDVLDYYEKIGLSASNSNIRTALEYLTPNTLMHYIFRQMERAGKKSSLEFEYMLNTYCDYLDMARKQGLNLSHEIFYKPKDLIAAHDACVEEGKKHEMEYRAVEILERFPDIQKNLDAIREKYTYEDDTFCIVVPAGITDILREGRSLGHCIDTTDRYFDRINQNISYLMFLRRKEDPKKSFYTLEIEPGGTVRQQRTTGNNQNKAEVEEYTPFIRKWQQEVRKRLTDEDRQQAAVSKDIRIREYQDLREKKEKVWHGKLAGQLLADVLEGDLIENAG